MNIAKDVTELIGRTPLVQLNRIADEEQVLAKIAMKLETYEPLASVKDRIAKSMIDDAEEKGLIERNKTVLIEPTSGNTGIGLAMVAAARGYKCILIMPDSLSIERRMVLLALGAEVVLTPKEQGLAAALERANQLAQEIPNAYQLNQFKNPANPKAHFETTGPEIWKDTNGNIDIFVSAVGTAGTIMGCKRYFDTQDKKVYTVAVEPDESAVLSGDKPGPHGIQGIGAGVVPPLFDKELVDEIQRVTTKQAMEMSRRLSKEEGIFVGISAGAAVQAAINVGKREENRDKLIVVIVPSFGERYFSTELFLALKQKAEAMTSTRVVMPTTV